MKKSLTILTFLSSASLALAQLAPGTYTGTQDSLKIATQTTDSVWTFNDVVFSNNGALNLADSNNAADYDIILNNTSTTVSELRVQRKGESSTNLKLAGTSDTSRSAITVSGTWAFYVNASTVEGATTLNQLSLAGYADINAQHLCMSSDAGFVSGTASVDISGASNKLTITGDSYFNANRSATRTGNTYFNISGVSGAKSVANFGTFLWIRAEGTGATEFNMKGYSEVNTGSHFSFGRDTYGDVNAKFEMSNSDNTLTCTNLFVGANATSGNVEFIIGGKNNTLTATADSYIGTDKASTGTTIFKVAGSGHDINFQKGFTLRKQSATDTAKLIFAADESGLSTINVASVGAFTGNLEIDMTDFVGDESGIYEVVLISAASDWASKVANCIGSSDDAGNVSFKMGANGTGWQTVYSGNELILSYTYSAIPEPATYAAIFGALALAFAAYRRRK